MSVSTAIIIDDHQLFSGGFRHVLLGLEGIDQVLCFDNPQSALEVADAENACLVVSDLYIPGYDMFVWIPRLRDGFANATCAVISSSISRTDREDCLKAGAHGYFEKHADPQLVIDGIEALMSRTEIEDGFLQRTARDAQNLGLTHKQIDILVHLARGLSSKEIALRFDISTETVKTHLANIYRLIGVSGRSAASNWAKRHGLI